MHACGQLIYCYWLLPPLIAPVLNRGNVDADYDAEHGAAAVFDAGVSVDVLVYAGD